MLHIERKKVLRKIRSLKKELDAEGNSKKPSTIQENALFVLRVDLNYILVRNFRILSLVNH